MQPGYITGFTTFNDSARNVDQGQVGDAVFNDSSYNDGDGTVRGNATFNHNSSNGGQIVGSATFNDSTICNGGSLYGSIEINGDPVATFSISGDYIPQSATFTRVSPWPPRRGINGSSILGVV